MKKCIIFCCFVFITVYANAQSTYSGTKVKNAWMIEQIYFDSIPALLDSTMAKYRLVPADSSICYLHDGKIERLCYWEFDDLRNQIRLLSDESELIFAYQVVYVDDKHLIVTVDLKRYNFPAKMVEYRMIPDPNFFKNI